jgi:phospholipase/lecithinase/hemolysin
LNAETAAFASRGVNDPNGLYIVFSGANDIGDILSSNLNPATVFATLLNGIQNAIQAFKAAGAQTIVVPNVPDLGLTPEALNSGTSLAATTLAATYNALLDAQLAAVTGVNLIKFDTFGWLDQVVADPAAFGLSNVSSACYSGFLFFDPTATECANPEDYLFWDRAHPSAVGQALLADRLFDAISPEAQPVPEPSSLSLVLLGAFVFLGMRRMRSSRKERT